MPVFRTVGLLVGLAAALVLGAAGGPVAVAAAPAGGSAGVNWTFADSVAACPAGDSVVAGHPARLRITVTYAPIVAGQPSPRAGVPPESVWVAWTILTGNARVNDQAARADADDSTNAQGETRITLPSLSGSGTLQLSLWVSGQWTGDATATLRSTDTDLDGRTTVADAAGDIDYSGAIDAADDTLASRHLEHSHRNALFGTLVRRTNLCETCDEYDPGAIGESSLSWSPDGRRIAFTIHTAPLGDCAVFVVPSDPADGDVPEQFSWPGLGVHDYDPSWSPLGTEVAFGRDDNTIWAQGVPGLNADTSLRLVTRHNDGTSLERGDLTPAISPEGVWVAFSRKSTAPGHWQIWKTPIDGDTTRRVQLTVETDGDDFYPQWSPDGQWILYDRQSGGRHSAWKVSASGGAPQSVLVAGGGIMASTPAFSPDGAMIVAGVGPTSGAATHTFDAALPGVSLPSALVVGPFPSFSLADANPVLTPRLSPDGTRLALRTNEIFAARRNMSRPPFILQVAGRTIDHRAPFVDLSGRPGEPMQFTIAAGDPEGDSLESHAWFLHDGMSFDPATRTFSWTPPQGVDGTTSNVRFDVVTPSGGADYAIARILVSSLVGVPGGGQVARFRLAPNEPNPFTSRTLIRFTLPRPATALVEVFDVSGRRARVLASGRHAAGAHTLEWDGYSDAGARCPPGLYLCRLSAGTLHAERKLLLLAD